MSHGCACAYVCVYTHYTEKGETCIQMSLNGPKRAWGDAVTYWIGEQWPWRNSTHSGPSHQHHLLLMCTCDELYISTSGQFRYLTSVWKLCSFSAGVWTRRALLGAFQVLQKRLQIDRRTLNAGLPWVLKMCLSDVGNCCHPTYAMKFLCCEIFQMNEKNSVI